MIALFVDGYLSRSVEVRLKTERMHLAMATGIQIKSLQCASVWDTSFISMTWFLHAYGSTMDVRYLRALVILSRG